MKNQTVPAEGHQILTVLDANKPIPYGINIDEGVQTWVLFQFEHLPPQFCIGCRRLGNKVSNCDEASLPPVAVPPPPPPSDALTVQLGGPSVTVGMTQNVPRNSTAEPHL